MSKAAKKTGNQPAEPVKLSKDKILPATRATLSTASTTLTLEQLNSELFKVYLAKKLVGLSAAKDDLHKVVVYGKAEAFKVDAVEGAELPDSPSCGFIFSEDTSMTIRNAASEEGAGSESQQLAVDCPRLCAINEKISAELRQYVELHRDAAISPANKFASLLLVGGEKMGKSTVLKLLLQELAGPRSPESPVEVKYLQLTKSTNLSNLAPSTLLDLKEKRFASRVLVLDGLEALEADKKQDLAHLLAGLRGARGVLTIGCASLQVREELASQFEKRLDLPALTGPERAKLLQSVFEGFGLQLDADQWQDIALRATGFNLEEFGRLAKNAQFVLYGLQKSPAGPVDHFKVVRSSLSLTKPINLTFAATTPNVRWADIGGYSHVKETISRVVELPMKNPELFKRRGIKPSKGILFYGPPGCSKTLFAKALATESFYNFIAVNGPEVFSKYVGDSEKAIRDTFAKARLNSPCIIFFDEIDSLAAARGKSTEVSDRVLIQLLTEMDGFSEISDVIVIGATNRPEILDPAIVRPGRLDEMLHISLPDREARLEILKIGCRAMQLGSDVSLAGVADRTEGYSGAEIIQLCSAAGYSSILRTLDEDSVAAADFEAALREVRPRISAAQLAAYESFGKKASLFK